MRKYDVAIRVATSWAKQRRRTCVILEMNPKADFECCSNGHIAGGNRTQVDSSSARSRSSQVPHQSQMPAISCLIFDLGGVLVRNAVFDRLNALLPAPIAIDELKFTLLASPAYRGFELGMTTPADFAQALVSELALGCTPADFLREFEAWPEGFYPGAIELLAELRKHYRIACLSNSNALHWARFDGFREHFDVALSSHLLKLIKPDAACFQQALVACGIPAGEALFFDDAAINVEAAMSCGIQSFHVRDFDDMRLKVRELGLLASPQVRA